MRGQAGFFDVDERLKQLSAKGDSLERLNAVVDFELFRADLERAVPRSDRSKGGRPPFDHVLMLKTLILQASHNLSDERTEYLIRDRLSFMRFLGLGLADTVPDANTIWGFREALTRARIADRPAIEVLFAHFDAALAAAGFLAMSGQIIDASIVAAPKQRNTDGEKRDIKEGRIPPEWANNPAKLRQKDRDARWTVKYTKAKPSEAGLPRIDLAIPAFGYKNQEPYRHRPAAPPDPPLDGHRCRPPRRGAAARVDRPQQHRRRCLGRYRLSLQGQREIPRRPPAALTDPPQETERQADAAPHRPGQCPQIGGTLGGRTCLRPAKRADGPVHPHHWDGPCQNQNRPRQSHLQYAANGLADWPDRINLAHLSRRRSRPARKHQSSNQPITDPSNTVSRRPESLGSWRCPNLLRCPGVLK
jgi:Transposase domain (DUF772)